MPISAATQVAMSDLGATLYCTAYGDLPSPAIASRDIQVTLYCTGKFANEVSGVYALSVNGSADLASSLDIPAHSDLEASLYCNQVFSNFATASFIIQRQCGDDLPTWLDVLAREDLESSIVVNVQFKNSMLATFDLIHVNKKDIYASFSIRHHKDIRCWLIVDSHPHNQMTCTFFMDKKNFYDGVMAGTKYPLEPQNASITLLREADDYDVMLEGIKSAIIGTLNHKNLEGLATNIARLGPKNESNSLSKYGDSRTRILTFGEALIASINQRNTPGVMTNLRGAYLSVVNSSSLNTVMPPDHRIGPIVEFWTCNLERPMRGYGNEFKVPYEPDMTVPEWFRNMSPSVFPSSTALYDGSRDSKVGTIANARDFSLLSLSRYDTFDGIFDSKLYSVDTIYSSIAIKHHIYAYRIGKALPDVVYNPYLYSPTLCKGDPDFYFLGPIVEGILGEKGSSSGGMLADIGHRLGPNDFLNSFNDVSFITDKITLKEFNNFANKDIPYKQATIMESKSLLKDLLGFDSEVNRTSLHMDSRVLNAEKLFGTKTRKDFVATHILFNKYALPGIDRYLYGDLFYKLFPEIKPFIYGVKNSREGNLFVAEYPLPEGLHCEELEDFDNKFWIIKPFETIDLVTERKDSFDTRRDVHYIKPLFYVQIS